MQALHFTQGRGRSYTMCGTMLVTGLTPDEELTICEFRFIGTTRIHRKDTDMISGCALGTNADPPLHARQRHRRGSRTPLQT